MNTSGAPGTAQRMPLAQLPTPVEFADRLTEAWGGPQIWIKRDDLTGFGLSGNKVRKLEYHVAAAKAAGCDTFVTCGAVQSNHCRATAFVAARAGLDAVLLLRSSRGNPPDEVIGNHFLQRLAGAEVRFTDRDGWKRRAELMDGIAAELATQGRAAWIMPAGASDRLGALSFEAALWELDGQADAAGIRSDRAITVWHASSSGGTTAGLAMGAASSGREWAIVGSSVGETRDELRESVDDLLIEAGRPDTPYEVLDEYVGLGYGQTSDEELAVQVEATRLTGQVWDPTYTGKALYALRREIEAGRFAADDHVVFWHTGGGFAAFAHDYSAVL